MRDGSLARYSTKLRHPQLILALLHGRELKSRGVKVRKGFCIHCDEVGYDWTLNRIEVRDVVTSSCQVVEEFLLLFMSIWR